MLIVALVAGLLTQFFPCCAFAIRSFSKVSATPAVLLFLSVSETECCGNAAKIQEEKEGKSVLVDLVHCHAAVVTIKENCCQVLSY